MIMNDFFSQPTSVNQKITPPSEKLAQCRAIGGVRGRYAQTGVFLSFLLLFVKKRGGEITHDYSG